VIEFSLEEFSSYGDGAVVITLYESFRAVFYTPFYLAHALGAYAAEGVDVALTNSPDLDYRSAHRAGEDANVYWGGPMRLMVARDRDPQATIAGFCEVVTRDPFFLIGRTPRPDFKVTDLAGLRFASVSEVPTPWMCLQDDLRRAGLDPSTLDRTVDGTMPGNAMALREGTFDVVQLFQPYVEELLTDGTGHIWYAQASRGLCSYTAFYAPRQTLDSHEDTLMRMTRAMYRTQKSLFAISPSEVAAAVAEFFPDVSREILTACIERYRALDIWTRTPLLPREGFQRLHDAMLSGGLIETSTTYEACVDTRFAERAIADDPPAL
jgi:NitT/TauT family transport system substrate-binding protein